jgi:hypothetical protein
MSPMENKTCEDSRKISGSLTKTIARVNAKVWEFRKLSHFSQEYRRRKGDNGAESRPRPQILFSLPRSYDDKFFTVP